MSDLLTGAISAAGAIASLGALILSAWILLRDRRRGTPELSLEHIESHGATVDLQLIIVNRDSYSVLASEIRLRRPRGADLYHHAQPPEDRKQGTQTLIVSEEVGQGQRKRVRFDVVAPDVGALKEGVEVEVFITPRSPLLRRRWHRVSLPAPS